MVVVIEDVLSVWRTQPGPRTEFRSSRPEQTFFERPSLVTTVPWGRIAMPLLGGGEHLGDCLAGGGPEEVVPLPDVASDALQEGQLIGRLDAFGHGA